MDSNEPIRDDRLDPDTLMVVIAEYLESLGPFPEGAIRADKWRTTEQLLHELNPKGWSLIELDEELLRREMAWEERLAQGLQPNTRIRRAYYPDRTTVLPLWGATKWLKPPTPGMSRRRVDQPQDLPEDLQTAEGSPTVFLSYSSTDRDLSMQIARETARLGLTPWMFETHIDHYGDIPKSVQAAIRKAECLISVVTRRSLASLWMLTELHSAYEMGKSLVMIIDANDDDLVHLFRSIKQQKEPDEVFDHGVQYCEAVVTDMAEDYGFVRDLDKATTYRQRVHDFLASIPMYQACGAAVAYPDVRYNALGPLLLAPFNDRLSEFCSSI